MNPGIFFLCAALTGMSILPSLTDTPASVSTMPSAWALFSIALILLDMAPSFSCSERLISYRSSDAVSFTSPYLSRIESMRFWTSGNDRMGELMRLRLGYTSSFTPSKNEMTLRRVSSMVLSFLREMRSIAEELLSRGLRKSMQSMKPPDGKLSSNIMIRRISSVRRSLLRICLTSVENVSVAVRPAA